MSEQRSPREGRRFPRDEFDNLPPGDGRRGAHRARPNPALAMVPVLLVVVAVVALVVGAMTLLGNDAPDTASPPGPVADATPEPTGQPTDGATGEPTGDPSSEPTAEPTESAPPVDDSAPVVVLNGTSTGGLAAGGSQQLTAAGWNVAGTGNYRDGPTPPTTVYYADEELSATAEAVAEDLGGASTELSTAFGSDGLTVVLGDDYQP